MFSRGKSPETDAPMGTKMATGARNTTFSIIGSDVVITGNISASVDLHVDGQIEGDLKCASLVQGEGSAIRGSVIAETARIAGVIEGSMSILGVHGKEIVELGGFASLFSCEDCAGVKGTADDINSAIQFDTLNDKPMYPFTVRMFGKRNGKPLDITYGSAEQIHI